MILTDLLFFFMAITLEYIIGMIYRSEVVKTLPLNPGGASSNPGQGVRMPHAYATQNKTKKEKTEANIIMNSIRL